MRFRWRRGFPPSAGVGQALLPLGLVLVVALPVYAQVPVEGLWTGVDSQGVPLSFVVTSGGRQVDFSSFGVSCVAGPALQTSPVAVSASQFALSFFSGSPQSCLLTRSLAGAFGSATTASGTGSSRAMGLACTTCFDERTWTASHDASVIVADLEVAVSDGRLVESPGAATTYTIEVTNKGPHPVGSFRLQGAPPLSEPSPAWSVSGGTYDSSTGSWAGAPLPAGGTLTFQVTGHLSASVGGEAVDTASVSAIGFLDPEPDNDSATDHTAVRTVAVAVSASTVAATPPTTIVLATSLANQGTVAAESVQLAFTIPPGLSFAGNTGACTTPFPCLLGTMAPASQQVITTRIELPPGYAGPDSLVFSASATTTTAEATSPSHTDSWTVRVIHPAPPALLHVLDPCRLLDTRSSNPIGPAGNSAGIVLTAVGSCGIPASARALALNVTVVQPTAEGDLQVSPFPEQTPLTSTINFRTGQTRANNAVVGLSPAGQLDIEPHMTGGTVHVLIDVSGYFE